MKLEPHQLGHRSLGHRNLGHRSLGHRNLGRRILGRVGDPTAGPRIGIVVGMHGNEPAGVLAAEQLLEELRQEPRLQGEVVAVLGNLGALAAKKRFLGRDLNRLFTNVHPDGDPEPDCPESQERVELQAVLSPWLEPHSRPFHLLDLHTASASSVPFGLIGDTLRSRWFARGMALPILFGLEEQLTGSLLEWVGRQGFITFGVEGGQHQDPESVVALKAACWLAIARARLVPWRHTAVQSSQATLARVSMGYPRCVEVRYRHALRAGDGFVMGPGFENFQPVEQGDLLGEDLNGTITAQESGHVLLPLYQGLGDDGFFLGRSIGPYSELALCLVRALGASRAVRLLSGVRGIPGEPDSLLVESGCDELLVFGLLTRLGYRRVQRLATGSWRVSRRAERPLPASS